MDEFIKLFDSDYELIQHHIKENTMIFILHQQ